MGPSEGSKHTPGISSLQDKSGENHYPLQFTRQRGWSRTAFTLHLKSLCSELSRLISASLWNSHPHYLSKLETKNGRGLLTSSSQFTILY